MGALFGTAYLAVYGFTAVSSSKVIKEEHKEKYCVEVTLEE